MFSVGSIRAASFTEFTSPVHFGVNPAVAGLKEESNHAQGISTVKTTRLCHCSLAGFHSLWDV